MSSGPQSTQTSPGGTGASQGAGTPGGSASAFQTASSMESEGTCGRAARLVTEHPTTTVAAAFLIGAGIGATLGTLLSHRPPASHRFRTSAEQVGEHILESLKHALPDRMRG